ncbi:MAG TPA: E3 binding domain-containing protein [Rubrobacteraceae bacterium]|nr:E3 binding domain-containing protein [Rubrobacteraceae bacterium]
MSRSRRPRDEEHPAQDSEERPVGEQPRQIEEADVLLDVPELNVEEFSLQAEQVRVRVSFGAELADMVKINVGLEAEVDDFELKAKGIEAQAQLKARLGNVREIFSQVLSTLDNNPSLIQDLLGAPDRKGDEPEGEPAEPPRRALEESPPDDSDASDGGDTRVNARRDGGARLTEDSATNGPRKSDATEAAEKKARQLGIELGSLEGTGVGGRVLLKDVVEAARK